MIVQGTFFLDVRLTAGSPGIDAGDTGDALCCFDLDGNVRAFDDPATPNTGQGISGLWVDHGAYEFGSFAPVVPDPTGACCLVGSCVVTTETECIASAGTYSGDDTDCAGAGCLALCLGDMDGDNDIDGDDVQLFVDALLGGGGLCP
ncbi:MAG: hypothetical protein O7B26_07790 [Planctomycetota bacterium]|nr:hypothetical protein [Planctomycetota bacterium]